MSAATLQRNPWSSSTYQAIHSKLFRPLTVAMCLFHWPDPSSQETLGDPHNLGLPKVALPWSAESAGSPL
jgi:hypothetical protein